MKCKKCEAKLTLCEWIKHLKNKNNPDKGDFCGACRKDALKTLMNQKLELIKKEKNSVKKVN